MRRLPSKRGGRSPYATIAVLNPGKGLNNLISDNLLDDREASSLENIMFVESGAPSKAYGYESVGSGLTNAPRGLGFYNYNSGAGRYLLTVDGTELKYLNGSTWTAISGAAFDSSSNITMTHAKGRFFIWDGVNGGATLDNLTLTRPGTMPKAKFSIFYGGYHIASGVDGQPNRIYISVFNDPADFTNDPAVADPTPDNVTDVPGATVFTGTGSGTAIAQFVDVNKDDGDKITGLAKFQDVLVIFKERSIFQLTLDATGVPTISAVTKSYGCVSHRSIDNVENDVFFLTRNGFYVLGNEPNFFNVIRTNELSARVHSEIEVINSTNFEKASALFNQYVYYCAIPSGGVTANNVVLTYDRRFQAWSKLTHMAVESFTVFVDSTNNETIYFTSSSTNKVYKMNTNYTADGAAISAQWTSKAFDAGDFNSYKRWIDCTILFRQLVGEVSMDFYSDNGNIAKSTSVSSSIVGGLGTYALGEEWMGGTPASSATVTASSNNIPYRIKLNTKSRNIKVKISNGRAGETFVVLGIAFRYRRYSPFSWPSSLKIS